MNGTIGETSALNTTNETMSDSTNAIFVSWLESAVNNTNSIEAMNETDLFMPGSSPASFGNITDSNGVESTWSPSDGSTMNGTIGETSGSSLVPLVSCWYTDPSTGQGFSMPVDNEEEEYDEAQEYVCISFCWDCAMSDVNGTLCTEEQKAAGTKVSSNMGIPLDALGMYETTYSAFGFMSCMTSDCNKADACSPSSNDSSMSLNATNSSPITLVAGSNSTESLPFTQNSSLSKNGGNSISNQNITAFPTSSSTNAIPTSSAGDPYGSTSAAAGSILNISSSTPSIFASLDTLSAPYTMSLSMESPSMPSPPRYGFSVAITGDASLVAVGATSATNSVTRDTAGAVYLYSLDKDMGTISSSLLQVIYGQSLNEEFGNSIALSEDGKRMVVASRSEDEQTGAMRVYQRDDEVTMAANASDATIVGGIDGSTSTNSYQSLSWSLMEGGVITGQNTNARAGWSVSISADGNVIAMGSPAGGNNKGGSILAFKYNNLSLGWEPYGSMIEGLTPGQAAGFSISLSGTGSTMIVGSPKAKKLDGTINTGKSAVYFMNGSEWQLLGREVYGEAESYIDGTSVAISKDGNVVVVGGKGRNKVNATTGEVILRSTGHCHVYQFESGQWEFQHSINGKGYEERLGFSVAVSSDGNVIACGGVSGVNGNSKSGVVRLWNRVTLQESTIWPRGEVADVEGATFGTSVAMSGDGEYVIVGAPTWGSGNGGGTSAGAIQMFRVVTS